MSQFWYDDHTSNTLAAEVLRLAGDTQPTVKVLFHFQHLSLNTIVDFKLLAHHTFSTTTIIQKKFPKTRNAYEVIIADPPFLSEGCLTKLEEAVRLLLTNSRFQNYLRTGAVMTENAEKLLSRKKNKFEPH